MTPYELGCEDMSPIARGAVSGDASDRTDLADLFRLHHGELVRLATMLVRSREAAEDIVQDVFAGVQARSASLARPREALPYLRAAVLNRCRSALRRTAVANRFGNFQAVDYGLSQPSAEAEFMLAERRLEVLTALARLPVRKREVLVLRYYLGLSEAEIADTLGISQGTVKSAAARGLAALARLLGEEA